MVGKELQLPRCEGQLVWCPSDPQLGVGIVTGLDQRQIRVRFLRLQEERAYTTRGGVVLVRYTLGPGDKVKDHQGVEHRVARVVEQDDDELTTYEFEDGGSAVENTLAPEVRDIGAKERLATLNLAHPEVVRARMEGLELASLGRRPGFSAIIGSRAQWLPHQIDVATRAIESDPVRLLLADEVGLGKTVEAALIYAGLRYEGRANRVLILTPTALQIQWLGEIYRKAHELMVLLDNQRIEDAMATFPDLSPFDAYQRVVTSITKVAHDPILASHAMEAEWDLVVVDEAHHLRWDEDEGGNEEYRLIEGLAEQTRHMLLLTATPMALDPAQHHALLRLLAPDRFDNPKAFESIRKRVVNIRDVARGVQTALEKKKALPKKLATSAAKVLDDDPEDQALLEKFLAAKPAAKSRPELAEELLAALRERHGLAEYVVRNRRGPVGGLPARKAEVFPLEPSELQSQLIEVGESVMLDLADTLDDPAERALTLGRLLRALWAAPRALADILRPISPSLSEQLLPYVAKVLGSPLDAEGLPTGDARLRWLVRFVRRMEEGDKVLVFVETAVAVRALRDALEEVLGGDIAMFHRGLAPRDQDRQVAWFRDPDGPKIMLSTEAGGEGRNFQFCHQVVLYDLPWRPATVEQRIGRIDRVGQSRDVRVLVPYFKSGYEAAILKVMQESIGVLDKTVGGIDHALEFVSERLAALILDGGSVDEWKALYLDTESLINDTRKRIEDAVDPILDHASFSAERAAAILAPVPEDLEQRTEAFVQGFADHSKMSLHHKGGPLIAVAGAPGAAGREDEDGFVATFSRTHALDHEDVEFLSFGHPLVEGALEWAQEASDASAALALSRGAGEEGAVFLWRFDIDLPEDVPEASTYFDMGQTVYAVDEAGKRQKKYEGLLDAGAKPLDRMDPTPLKGALGRWKALVEQNFQSAEVLASKDVKAAREDAMTRLELSMARRRKELTRQQAREKARVDPKSKKDVAAMNIRHGRALDALEDEMERLLAAVENARPRLISAVAVRLMRAKRVSG